MAETKVKCAQCSAMILPATAARTGGVCMPCFRGPVARLEITVTAEDEVRFRAIDAIRRRLEEGCTEEEFDAIGCPVCGAKLSLNVHPFERGTFNVRCTRSSAHMSTHGKNPNPPDWLDKYVTLRWYGIPQEFFERRLRK